MGRAESITSAVRKHDYKLFCKHMEGKLCVMRKSNRVETYDIEGKVVHFVRPASDFVFALTHNWKKTGYDVDWGIEPVMARLKAIDLWNRDLVADIEKQEELRDKETESKRKHDTESFLYEFRDNFKKTFNDVNTANMSKQIKKRRL